MSKFTDYLSSPEHATAVRMRRELGEINTAELPPHDPDATCPKCGADARQVMVAWHSVAPDVFGGIYLLAESHLPCRGKCLNEHLCRTCGRCGYSWQEHTVGAGDWRG